MLANKRLTKTEKKWIEAVLTNDETSTDEEMIAYFVKEGKFNYDIAKEVVSLRFNYLGKI